VSEAWLINSMGPPHSRRLLAQLLGGPGRRSSRGDSGSGGRHDRRRDV